MESPSLKRIRCAVASPPHLVSCPELSRRHDYIDGARPATPGTGPASCVAAQRSGAKAEGNEIVSEVGLTATRLIVQADAVRDVESDEVLARRRDAASFAALYERH